MQSKNNVQHNKNVGQKHNTNNSVKNGNYQKNNQVPHKGNVQNVKNKSGVNNQNQKNVQTQKKVTPKVEILDLNTATPEIETELPVKNQKVAPILEPDKNPTIVIPVIKTEPETVVPTSEPVTEVPKSEPITQPMTEPVVVPVTEPVVEVSATEVQTTPAVNNLPSNPQSATGGKNNKKVKKIIIFGVLVLIVVAIVIGVAFFLNREERTETLTEIDESDKVKFMLGEEEFYLGETVSSLKKKGLTYEDDLIRDTDYIVSDSIAVYPFYYEGEAVLLGALYCPTEENCKYDDAVLIKANFYENVDVVVDEYIKTGLYYDDIKDEYGKKDGKFYQDKEFYVWTFGEDGKIGEPYYLLRFNSSEKLEEIRIGVWWYEEEFEFTVK